MLIGNLQSFTHLPKKIYLLKDNRWDFSQFWSHEEWIYLARQSCKVLLEVQMYFMQNFTIAALSKLIICDKVIFASFLLNTKTIKETRIKIDRAAFAGVYPPIFELTFIQFSFDPQPDGEVSEILTSRLFLLSYIQPLISDKWVSITGNHSGSAKPVWSIKIKRLI